METYYMFLYGGLITCLITLLVNVLFKKQPKTADRVIDYIVLSLMVILLTYAVSITDWDPVEKKLSKELQEYRDIQKNVWWRK